MSRLRGLLVVAAATFVVTPLAGQERAVVFQVHGGGYDHMRNLNTTGNVAHFKTGYSLGGAVGLQINEYVGVFGDVTLARTEGRGAVAFANQLVNRVFVGGQLEFRYPMGRLAPFIHGGAGAVVVDQQGPEADEDFDHFTRAAGMFGAGLSYQFPGAPFGVFAEWKALTYKWIAAPFSRIQWDQGYSLGFSYRVGF